MGLFDAVGGVLSSGIGAITGAVQNKKNRKFQREMQAAQNAFTERMWNQQNEWNLAQWNRENEYNSPQAQMQRMMDAGINPNNALGGISSNNTAGSVQADSVTGAGASGNGVAVDLSDVGSNAIRDMAAMTQSVMNEKLTQAQINKTNQETFNLKQQAQSAEIQLWNDATFSNRERSAALANQVQSTHVLREQENKLKKEVDNLDLDAQGKKIANNFLKEHNQWLLKQDEQELQNMGQIFKQIGAQIASSNAQTNLANKQARNADTQNRILTAEAESAEAQAEIDKDPKVIAAEKAFREAQSKEQQQQALYQAYRYYCQTNGVDPDSPSGTRYWQIVLKNWETSGNFAKEGAAGLFRTIGAVLDKAGGVVGAVAGAGAGAYFGAKRATSGSSNASTTPRSSRSSTRNP